MKVIIPNTTNNSSSSGQRPETTNSPSKSSSTSSSIGNDDNVVEKKRNSSESGHKRKKNEPNAGSVLSVSTSCSSGNDNVDKKRNSNEIGHKRKKNELNAGSSSSSSSSSSNDMVHGKKRRKAQGLEVRPMKGDGNCLFRAVSYHVFGEPEWHQQVRDAVVNYMGKERNHFSQFVVSDFDEYVKRMKMDGVFGGDPEIQAFAEMYNRSVQVYELREGQVTPVNLFQGNYKSSNAPIRLLYRNGNHYDAIVDPYEASVGVGLGLPNFEPGKVEKDLIEQTRKKSMKEFYPGHPESVQELVCNGFELSKVLQAYDLVGDSFDDMLAYLLVKNDAITTASSSSTSSSSSSTNTNTKT